jgi:hypothetical protein
MPAAAKRDVESVGQGVGFVGSGRGVSDGSTPEAVGAAVAAGAVDVPVRSALATCDPHALARSAKVNPAMNDEIVFLLMGGIELR